MDAFPSSLFRTLSLRAFMSAGASEGNILIVTRTWVNFVLGSSEAALWTLVRTAKAAAFFASPYRHFAALWARKMNRSLAGQYHASAPVAGGHPDSADFCY